MPDADEIQVLLATYNGARYLTAQLTSILAQEGPVARVLARDDGSSDETRSILAAFAARFPDRVTVLPDHARTGSPKENVARLLSASTARYVMLADQDDVWQPSKLSRSLAAMRALERRHGQDRPLLVFTDLSVVERDLTVRAPSYWLHQKLDPRRIHSLPRLLRQNVVTGCTTLLNRALIALSLPMPAGVFMHDWWMALVACTLGEAGYVREATVLYRQHDDNAVGIAHAAPRSRLPRLRHHAHRRAEWARTSQQAAALLEAHEHRLTTRDRAVLHACVRCTGSEHRLVRLARFVRHGFWHSELRKNLGTLWYLWDAAAPGQ